MAIRYYEQDVKSLLKNKRKLSVYLKQMMMERRKELQTIDLTYIFCSDEYLLQINQEFLNHDTLTDIVTFDLSEKESNLNGEIYISIDRVRENGEKFKVSYEQELHRVIFHGALHLCGLKDKKKEDKEHMRLAENYCLTEYFGTVIN